LRVGSTFGLGIECGLVAMFMLSVEGSGKVHR
jgi:hypothetical protein